MMPLEDCNAGKERVWRGAGLAWFTIRENTSLFPSVWVPRRTTRAHSQEHWVVSNTLWQSLQQKQRSQPPNPRCCSCTASGVPAVRGVHPTRGISLPAQRSRVLLEPGQSHGLDQPSPEKSSAASHTWWVQGFWLLTSARKEAFLTSLYKNHTFLEGKVQKRQSTLVSLWRNLRRICWGEPTVLQVWKEMGERKREGALNVFLQGYQDITGKDRVWRGAMLVWFQISPSKKWARGTTKMFWKPFWSSPILSVVLWPWSIFTILVLIGLGIDAV